MSVTPEKNACNVWLAERGCYVHGDSYHFPDGLLVIRTCARRTYEELQPPEMLHYSVCVIQHWFDEERDYGVLFVQRGFWTYYGYDGKGPISTPMQ